MRNRHGGDREKNRDDREDLLTVQTKTEEGVAVCLHVGKQTRRLERDEKSEQSCDAVLERDRRNEIALVNVVIDDIRQVGDHAGVTAVIQEKKKAHKDPNLDGIARGRAGRDGKRGDPKTHRKLDRTGKRMPIRIAPEGAGQGKARETSEHVHQLDRPDREGKLMGV